LIDYDRRTRSSLIETLRQILRSPYKVGAASCLNVHVSTVRYRHARIEQILGLRLDDAEHAFNLNLALRVLDVTGLLERDGEIETAPGGD
jgi:DNA-binding PucR family transcriptional regulator